MPVFKNADTLYAVMRRVLDEVAAKNADAFAEMIKNRLTVRFKMTEPAGEFTIDGKARPPKMTYGTPAGHPDIDLDLCGDDLDRLLKHEISATQAVTDGTIKFKGNPFKLRALLDVIKAGSVVYMAAPNRQR
jgi:alkyl sulfatase BDS1-like metallo-beta-lactamase superfamily hydrolase